jgi:hypothetical protein
MCEGEEEALSRARVCAASRNLTSVASSLWRAAGHEDKTAYSCRRRIQEKGSLCGFLQRDDPITKMVGGNREGGTSKRTMHLDFETYLFKFFDLLPAQDLIL